MNFTIALSSIGFIGRFAIAFIILAYLHSQDKSDPHLRSGFKWLCIIGAIVFVLMIVAFIAVFFVGGFGILSQLFDGAAHNYGYNMPYNFPY